MYEDVQHSGYIGMQSDRLCNCVYLFRYQDFVYGHEYYYFVKKIPFIRTIIIISYAANDHPLHNYFIKKTVNVLEHLSPLRTSDY